MRSLLSSLGELALQTLYPPRCPGCGVALFGHSGGLLCGPCAATVDWLDNRACSFCGAPPGPHATLGRGCPACRGRAFSFTRAVGAARYRGAVREVVKAFKFGGREEAARPMAQMMARRAETEGVPTLVDSLLPVPLHRRRLRERGFNQSARLASALAEELGLPWEERMLTRRRYTTSQALLDGPARRQNLVNAFGLAGSVEGARVLLIDDVMTTGATVDECARLLRQNGARRIYVLVFARGG